MQLPRPWLRLTTMMTWLVVIGLTLALVAQHRVAERRDRALKVRLAKSLSDQFAQEGYEPHPERPRNRHPQAVLGRRVASGVQAKNQESPGRHTPLKAS